MQDVVTKFVRYMYLDVVDFTAKRSVEAQIDIVDALNAIVRRSISTLPIQPERVLYLPTGDGMGIAFLDELAPYDIHLVGAVEIIRQNKAYNLEAGDPMRRFEVRIGLNQNVDNVIIDINGSKNVAGDGINTAQRVMNVASGSQIFVSQMVFEVLSHREKYLNSFKAFTASIKHGIVIPVYQLIDKLYEGLNIEPPPQFEKKNPAEQQLSLYEAYFVAHALANSQFTLANSGEGQHRYALTVLYHFIAEDSAGSKTRSRFLHQPIRQYGSGKESIGTMFSYYMSVDFWVICSLAAHVEGQLRRLAPYFQLPFLLVNENGRSKLRSEYPEICEELRL